MRIWRRPELWWRVLIVVAGVTGLWAGDSRIVYYTTQSNLVVAVYFGAAVYWMVRRNETVVAAPRLRGPVTAWILVTGLVAHFLLNDGANPFPGLVHGAPAEVLAERSTFLVHYVVPVMVLADWVMFGPRRVSAWRELPAWLLFPLGYGLLSELRAAVLPAATTRYPYFFLDPAGQGYGGVALWMLALGLGIYVLGAVLLGLDRALSKPAAAPEPSPVTTPTAAPEPRPATADPEPRASTAPAPAEKSL
ncbi:Pr6Pr family membrane protein [Symbioplanes lichenis]|uniref:Pr6Pr family membrane protein n=1 Tax=Symbioplanes lichenis TaxID=1629072 RepID=UPI00273A3E1F|nr:Pr6Pr family membrane protein [Actinoplanes lichenis]